MAGPETHHLFHSAITDHAFSSDRQTLAVARENNVSLYNKTGSGFTLQDELKGHDKTVTGVDIAPNSGMIVTCSQDRNAYVWTPTPSKTYTPTLVLLRLNRAATSVRWSPSEAKFAVASGARCISICSYETEENWWVSKHLKRPIKSTVTSVAWHPNSVLLAGGSTDGHARVWSAFVKDVEGRPAPTVWGERLPFGTVCGEYLNRTAGWVHSVAFSPDGDALAFASHDSSVTIVYPSAPEQAPRAVVSVSTQVLPFTTLVWTRGDEILGAGYDCEVFRMQGGEGGWEMVGSLEKRGQAGKGAVDGVGAAGEDSARNMFKQMDLKGRGSKDDTKLVTVHQNTISTIRAFEGEPGAVRKISSTGVDGRVVIWNV